MSLPPSRVDPVIRSAPTARQRTQEEVRQDLRALPYESYLRTSWWRARRNEALRDAKFRCNRCDGKRELQVHHLSYEHLGDERPEDLEVLCRGCHSGEHFNQVQSQIGLYRRIISDVLASGTEASVTDVLEEAKARCAKLKITIKPDEFHAAAARVLPRVPFTPPEGKAELFHVGAEHEPLTRAEAAGILARLGAASAMHHMPNVRPLTVREMERRRALAIVAQAIQAQIEICETVEAPPAGEEKP